MISTPILLLVLLSALMHAGWNYLVKASPDALLDTVGLALGGSLLAACLVPWIPLPARESWPWLGVTVIVHVAYFYVLIETYRHADLSVAYPLMRGTAPVVVALAAPLFGEPVSLALMAGVMLVGIGIMLPAWIGFRAGAVLRAGIGFAFANSLIIALYTVIDGIGVRLSGSAMSYVLWLFLLDAWGIFAIAWLRRGGGAPIFQHLRRRWKFAAAGSLLTTGSYGIVLWAMTAAPIPAIAALREFSVVFAALLGSLFLKERMGGWRIAGASMVASGVAIIRWG